MGAGQGEYTRIHRVARITVNSWSLHVPGEPQICVEVVRLDPPHQYGVVWARGNRMTMIGGLDQRDAQAHALAAREKYAPAREWLDTSVR